MSDVAPAHATDSPSALLQLVAHPLRWRLLGELAHSDRVVLELTRQLGEPQSLVSYHLGKLREAGLVRAQRSAADRRDSYYSIDLVRLGSLLATIGGALHPGLRSAVPTPTPQAANLPSVRVLFLCTGNSARSQMAEALLRTRTAGRVQAHSAGNQPKPVHPNAVRAMRELHGIDIAAQQSKHLDVYAATGFDWVISLCDRVRETCPPFLASPATIHWSIANPVVGDLDDDVSYPTFCAVAQELDVRIGFLLALLDTTTAAVPNFRSTEDPS